MIYGESFKPRDTFGTDITGPAGPVVRLRPNDFDGPIASWANDRVKLFGEKVVPKEVYIEQPPYKKGHRVAWVFHEGISGVSGEPFAVHHVACDCSGFIEEAETHKEREAIMSQCPATIPVIEKHAQAVNATYQIANILKGLNYDRSRSIKTQGKTIRQFIGGSIISLLERDYAHPESWIANVESGWTVPGLMALVLQIPAEDVELSVSRLVKKGKLEANDNNFGLAQQRKDTLDLNGRFDRIVNQLR